MADRITVAALPLDREQLTFLVALLDAIQEDDALRAASIARIGTFGYAHLVAAGNNLRTLLSRDARH